MKLFNCDGYWVDTKERFTNMIVSNGEWDGKEDAKDEKIFYYTDGDHVMGRHGDFVIDKAVEL
jgi:hypothetical protein